MPTLYQLIPDVEVLLALAPADLAPTLLRLARDFSRSQQRAGAPGGFIPEELTPDERLYNGIQGSTEGYSLHKGPEIKLALAEAWHWLSVNQLILPAPGIDGRNGRKVLSRQAASLATDEDFARFKDAATFPKALLHPIIADKVRLALARGDLDDAVFIAFKAVEVAVRDADPRRNLQWISGGIGRAKSHCHLRALGLAAIGPSPEPPRARADGTVS